eukprot:CAMPEP_0194366338 /NCGR_PEP_ID=MMETSP0174-20130528/14383_1 /TAXON_ID=216777 /ORGANISM="Proboscia alata, Strain PI-D3" /LENGTH=31 /DNA_ID= /DNA_START= /DNA_END= /DNA_ORIENTATION=
MSVIICRTTCSVSAPGSLNSAAAEKKQRRLP